MEYRESTGGVLLPANELLVGGRFTVEHRRDGKILDIDENPNLVVNEGLNAFLNIMFNGATQIPTWYIGIFEGNYTPVAGVTAATIASAATECTAYDETTRPTYVEAASTAASTTNSASRATFTINATKTVYGAFLVSNNTKGGTTGTLFAATRFGTAKSVVDNDELLITYTLNVAST